MSRGKKSTILSFFFSSKVVILVGLVLLALVSVALSKELIRKHKVNQEIEEVKNEIIRLEKKNKELSALIEYLNTDSYKEIQARQDLNLQKEGEKTVAVMQVERVKTDDSEGEKFEIQTEAEKSNPKKWWGYFFERK